MSRSSEGHNVAYLLKDLDLGNNVCEYEVNGWIMKKLFEENETLTQTVNDAGRQASHRLDGFHQSISGNFLRKIRLKINPFYKKVQNVIQWKQGKVYKTYFLSFHSVFEVLNQNRHIAFQHFIIKLHFTLILI